jgi:hypothetical protein
VQPDLLGNVAQREARLLGLREGGPALLVGLVLFALEFDLRSAHGTPHFGFRVIGHCRTLFGLEK